MENVEKRLGRRQRHRKKKRESEGEAVSVPKRPAEPSSAVEAGCSEQPLDARQSSPGEQASPPQPKVGVETLSTLLSRPPADLSIPTFDLNGTLLLKPMPPAVLLRLIDALPPTSRSDDVRWRGSCCFAPWAGSVRRPWLG